MIVSRGELVEIGGGFRIPDVIVQGGARLVEVGTTNRTRLADYRAAITPATRVLLKVHQSNYRVIGFTEEASLADLAGVGARRPGLTLVHDLGSGALGHAWTGARAHAAGQHRRPGVDVVAFSGDKLVRRTAGRHPGRSTATAIAALKRHPLMRAVTVGQDDAGCAGGNAPHPCRA